MDPTPHFSLFYTSNQHESIKPAMSYLGDNGGFVIKTIEFANKPEYPLHNVPKMVTSLPGDITVSETLCQSGLLGWVFPYQPSGQQQTGACETGDPFPPPGNWQI